MCTDPVQPSGQGRADGGDVPRSGLADSGNGQGVLDHPALQSHGLGLEGLLLAGGQCDLLAEGRYKETKGQAQGCDKVSVHGAILLMAFMGHLGGPGERPAVDASSVPFE